MITERLLHALQHIESMTPDMQDELAEQIEEMTEPLEPLDLSPERQLQSDLPLVVESMPESVRVALALGGAWSDLQGDDEFDALDRIRHATPPSLPVDEQLAWLDEDRIDAR